MRVSPQQVAFASGEISALLWNRPDYVRHRTGLERCRGFVPLPEGVVTRAPGTEHLGRVRGDGAVRLIDFVFRDDDSYMLEFTPLRMRVWRNGALVLSGPDPYELVTPYPAESLPRLQTVQSADRVYIVDGLRAPQRLSRAGHASWTIEATPFTAGPFADENDDKAVTIRASAATGVVTLTGVGAPFTGMHAGLYVRLDAVDQDAVPLWTGMQNASVGDRMSYDGRTYEIVSFDGSPSSPTTGPNPPTHDDGDWLASKAGPVWRYIHAGYGIVRIDAVGGPNAATATVVRTLPEGVVAKATWRWSGPAWSNTAGWPRAIAETDQRVIYAGTASKPRGIWASAIGDPLDMERGIDPDDGFGFTIAAGRKRLNQILWIEEGASGLHIGTSGGTTTARPTDQGLGLGPATTTFLRGERTSSAAVLPEVVDGEPVFLSATRRQLHGLRYRLDDDRVRADEISQNARHILYPGAVAMAWQEEPWRILWIALSDGQLVGLTLYPEQEVFAFHRHDPCGGKVKSLAVKPTNDGASEELWLAVERVVGGATRVFVERMAPIFFEVPPENPFPRNAWHQFCAVRWESASPSATVTGLAHLAGESVVAWTSAGAQAGVVAVGGTLALAEPATWAIVGLCAAGTQKLRTLPLLPQTNEGGADGRRRRAVAVGARCLFTADGELRVVATDERGRETVDGARRLIRPGAEPFASLTELWSGVVEFSPGSGWSDDVRLELVPMPGAPVTLTGLTPALSVGDA